MEGIGEARLYPRWWRRVHQKKEVGVMEKVLKEVQLNEVIAICRYKLAKGKTKFVLPLPPSKLPPIPPFKRKEVKDTVVNVIYEMFVRPTEEGGWLIKVSVKETEPFNSIGEALKKIIAK